MRIRSGVGGTRPGASTLGCLFWLLVGAAVIYFGFNAIEVYWKQVEFGDVMKQQVRFAGQRTDAEIIRRLKATADSLELPEEAHVIYVTRAPNRIVVEAQYEAAFELPFYVRRVRFHPRAEGPY